MPRAEVGSTAEFCGFSDREEKSAPHAQGEGLRRVDNIFLDIRKNALAFHSHISVIVCFRAFYRFRRRKGTQMQGFEAFDCFYLERSCMYQLASLGNGKKARLAQTVGRVSMSFTASRLDSAMRRESFIFIPYFLHFFRDWIFFDDNGKIAPQRRGNVGHFSNE